MLARVGSPIRSRHPPVWHRFARRNHSELAGKSVWCICMGGAFPTSLLSEMRKRPTRSKSYKTETNCSETEHRAFQTVLGWLWDRYVCSVRGGKMRHRKGRKQASDEVDLCPGWVKDALRHCQACELHEPCEAMTALRIASGASHSVALEGAASEDQMLTHMQEPPRNRQRC